MTGGWPRRLRNPDRTSEVVGVAEASGEQATLIPIRTYGGEFSGGRVM
jgi:hypothetical protein